MKKLITGCHDIMTLYFDLDKLCYTCEEYSFLLAAELIAVNCNNAK